MNILEITEVFYPVVGGAGKIAYLSASGLVKRGHKVSVLTRKDKDLKEKEIISGIDIYRLNWFNNFFALPVSFLKIVNFVRSFSKKNNLDLIVFNQPFSAFCALWGSDLTKISKIYRYHSSWFEEFKVKNNIQELKITAPLSVLKWIILSPIFSAMKAMESFALRNSDTIIVTSQYSKEKLIKFYKIDDNKIHIIPGCVDTEVFKPAENKQDLRNTLNIPQDRYVLITARNLVPRMGIDNLIFAFDVLSKICKDLYLIIIGEGKLKIKLEKLVRKLSLDKLVKFTGQLEERDLVKYYQASDLFILPTKYIEHFGLVSIEALASGIPVLGTPVGGTIEIFSKFNREFLFENTNLESITQGIKKFLEKNKGIDLKDKCREFVIREYPLNKMIDMTEKAFLDKMIEKEKKKKILVINLAGIGDLVMATPAIKALRRQFQDAEISLLVYSFGKELVENCPHIDNLFVLDKKLTRRDIDTLIELRRIHFDVAINLYNIYTWRGAFNMAMMLKIIASQKTLGRDTDGKGFFFDYKITEKLNDRIHQVQRIFNVVKLLGAENIDTNLEVWVSEKKQNNLEGFLVNNKITKEDFIIGINPGSVRLSRRWPIENFAIIADELKNKYRAKIVITGNKSELELAENFNKLSREKHVISTGKLSLSDLVNFIRMCKLYISNDTGPMHIANALGIPLVAIMGGGQETTHPYIKKNVVILKKDINCSPCFRDCCGRLDCLKAISPQDVLKACQSLLE